MAPSATDTQSVTALPVSATKSNSPKPWVKATGALDQYEHFDTTPVIGREYPHAKLAQWIKASNSDDLIRELALTSK
jgi:hypothetical protein